jgi:hypothetical protein
MTLIDSRPTIMAAFGGLAGEAGVNIDLAAVDARLGIKLPKCSRRMLLPRRSNSSQDHSSRRLTVSARHSETLCPDSTAPGSVPSGACCTGSTNQSTRSSSKTSSIAPLHTVAGRARALLAIDDSERY